MNTYDPTRVLDALYRVTGKAPKQTKPGQYSAVCPAHDDKRASLSFMAAPDKGKIHCQTGVCGHLDILNALDLTIWDLFPPRDQRDPAPGRVGDDDTWMPCTKRDGHRHVATYRYTDPAGTVVFGVARCDRKDFFQWRPDPTSKSGRKWSRTLPDGTKAGAGLLYRLPEVLANLNQPDRMASKNVFVVEGEKDADRLWSLGQPATCCAEGAGKWTPHHAEWLKGADVIVVADRDEAGWKHAETVVASLVDLARSVEVVRAADGAGKDVSDHLDAGLKLVDLVTVAEPKPAPAIGLDGEDVYQTAGAL